MTPLFQKLNFKSHPSILVLNPPESFLPELEAMADQARIHTDELPEQVTFALAFVLTLADIEKAIRDMAPRLASDAVLWFCYPKGSSKRYRCEFNRDTGWAALAPFQLEPVRQVSIDEDWTALRFRNVQHIKKITRRESFALTDDAKKRTTKKGE